MSTIFFALLFYNTIYSITVFETYFNQEFIVRYNTPGFYNFYPKDYKYAPTIFVAIYGAGGGTSFPYQQRVVTKEGSCTGQDGAYLSVLLDTRSGTNSFKLEVGKGGVGEKQNIIGCDPNTKKPIFGKSIQSKNGGDSSIILENGKFFVSKGGIRVDDSEASCPGLFIKDKGGYTNVSIGHGIVLLERQDGAGSYFGKYFNFFRYFRKFSNHLYLFLFKLYLALYYILF